jgi:hypothetical protein
MALAAIRILPPGIASRSGRLGWDHPDATVLLAEELVAGVLSSESVRP